MLDATTKTNVDSARDILVGKVPDPKSQVEQITIALIYKFMDDMDRQSEELGGRATFFAGEFKKYRWSNLLDTRFSGHERLLLYAEGMEKMNENRNIPQLFRDIFKGVFLPYRDPETLNLFLKEINRFIYDHSERLGDAYEYLLNVLGTQGAAGQFRTPRHIIDFIVAVIDPKKQETVLDPACGTAGFLISAFKHILRNNENLTPDERARLMTNFRGYDIAPDMVRLSRVNMYLHGFPNPVIHEYDTLTSEERWDERCDVIMANPPFMTPKGGIRPHNRFAIKAKRSEVLFVDYIAEHLTPAGRAGIIVPEGIIFQSQNAYRHLRRMLVENYLWAVVSLPGGVFNPYSGVKTSMLFLDRSFAKRTHEVIFAKVENDGFDLGAQRKPIKKDDLPEALKMLLDWKIGIKKGSQILASPSLGIERATIVPRSNILESPNIDLSGDRYHRTSVRANGKWPMVKLGEVCSLFGGGTPSRSEKRFWEKGTIKWISAKHINEYDTIVGWDLITEEALKESATNLMPTDAVIVVTRVSVGKITILREPVAINQDLTGLIAKDPSLLKSAFLFWVLKGRARDIADSARGLGVKGVTRQFISEMVIPLPTPEEQEQLVAELEGYRKVIEGARQVLAYHKLYIPIDMKWPIRKAGELCELVRGSSPRPKADQRYYGGNVPRLMIADLTRDGMYVTPCIDSLTDEGARYSRLMHRNDVVMAVSGNPGLPAILKINAYIHDGFVGFRCLKANILPEFLYHVLYYLKEQSDSQSIGAVFRNLTTAQIKSLEIPVPPLEVQQRIVAELEEERRLVEANRELITRMEAKIRSKLAEVWGEEPAVQSG